jgi:hypothetical protein
MNSLLGTLQVVSPHLSGELIAPGARDALAHATSLLPASWSRCMYLECRGLNDAVDLIINVDRAEMVAGEIGGLALPPSLADLPEWQAVVALARAWRSKGLSDHFSGIWLEFDLSLDCRSPPRPSVFVDFAPSVYHNRSAKRAVAAIVRATCAVGRPVSPPIRECLYRYVAALPRPALLLYAGFMLPRQTDAVRLCIMGMTPTELEQHLRDIGWSGHFDIVMALVRALGRLGEPRPAILHFDVGEDRASSVGLEYPFARHPQLVGGIREAPVLDYLVAQSYLTAARRAALSTWTGYERRVLPHELWPSVVVRRVNHIKLVVHPDASVETKLYLAVEHAALRSRRHAKVPE